MLTPLLAIAPATVSWSPKVGLVMIACNVIAIGIGKATIKYPNVGAKLPERRLFWGHEPRIIAGHNQSWSRDRHWSHSWTRNTRSSLILWIFDSYGVALPLLFYDFYGPQVARDDTCELDSAVSWDVDAESLKRSLMRLAI